MPLKIDVVTIFPELFPGPLAASIPGRALDRGLASLASHGFSIEVDESSGDIDAATLEAELKYRGYLKRDEAQWARTRLQEDRPIPQTFEYRDVPGLSREVIERLSSVRPATIGQAGRVPGVTPAAVAIVTSRLLRGRWVGTRRAIPVSHATGVPLAPS